MEMQTKQALKGLSLAAFASISRDAGLPFEMRFKILLSTSNLSSPILGNPRDTSKPADENGSNCKYKNLTRCCKVKQRSNVPTRQGQVSELNNLIGSNIRASFLSPKRGNGFLTFYLVNQLARKTSPGIQMLSQNDSKDRNPVSNIIQLVSFPSSILFTNEYNNLLI